jgi:hypothetical protein
MHFTDIRLVKGHLGAPSTAQVTADCYVGVEVLTEGDYEEYGPLCYKAV